jgi:hypothetical protein
MLPQFPLCKIGNDPPTFFLYLSKIRTMPAFEENSFYFSGNTVIIGGLEGKMVVVSSHKSK